MPRKTHVYRLIVTYPQSYQDVYYSEDLEWEPDNWKDEVQKLRDEHAEKVAAAKAAPDPDDPFAPEMPPPFVEPEWQGWPVNRMYFSKSGAQDRAWIFEKWGATVEIEQSNPVTWGDIPDLAPRAEAIPDPEWLRLMALDPSVPDVLVRDAVLSRYRPSPEGE